MKIIIQIIIFLLLATTTHAGIFGKIEAGKDIGEHNIFYEQATLGYKFTFFDITSRTFGGWKTWQYLNEPFCETYLIGQSFRYKGFFTEINHYCSHQILAGDKDKSYNRFEKYNCNPQAMTLFKIGYEFEIK